MNLFSSSGRRALRACASLILVAGVAASALAQATGSIAGRVSDASTGKSLQGAIVRVVGTTAVDYTDADGRFVLSGIPAGMQQVGIEYVGLDAQTREVTVTGSGVTLVNTPLEGAALKMEAFTVASSVRGQALAINQQKTASGIVNIVSEETFGPMLNGNIGYTLQQLPGLSVNEDEDGTPSGVNIRGLEAKYNSFQIDGNRMPTSDNSRAFSTGQLTADGISNIEVIKAATPDRDGDAIGGIINVIPRSAFQRDGRTIELTGSGVYYDKYGKWDYDTGLNYLDLYSVGGGEKNLGLSLTLTRHKTARDYDNLDKDYALLRPANEPALGLTDPMYFHTNGTPQTNFRDTEAQGANLSLDFRASTGATFYFRPFYSHNRVVSEKPRNRYYINSNHSFGSATGTKSIAEATYNTGRSAPNVLNDIRYQNDQIETDNDVYGASLGGKFERQADTITLDLFRSTNESNRDRSVAYVVRNPGFNIGYDQTDRAHPKYTILNGKDPLNTSTINRGDLTLSPRDGAEEATSAKLDWERKFVGAGLSGALKIGGKYRTNTKEQDQASVTYRTGTSASGFPYADLLRLSTRTSMGIPLLLEPDIRKVESLLASRPELFARQATDALLNGVINDYRAQEDIAAGYFMGTLTVRRTTLIAGLRAEHNTFKSDTYRYNSATPATPTPIRAERDYTMWLPGLHLRHEIRPNLILRASYNRSYARPDIDDLVAGLNLDPNTGNISGGNPNLSETTSNNFDAQLEYYTPKGGLYSAGLFYKKMKGFYYGTTLRFTTTDAAGYPIPDATGPYIFSTSENALGAVNYGLELIARQKLNFLPRPLNGFSVSLSGTFTESDGKYPGRLTEKLPTYGFSDTIYNAALEYAAGNFRGRLSYTYRADFLEGLDVDNTFDDYFGAYESLNWDSSYQVNQNLKLFFNVNNLTAEPQISYQGYQRPDNPEDYTTYSWRATTGFSLRF